jgi:hypothetical protein
MVVTAKTVLKSVFVIHTPGRESVKKTMFVIAVFTLLCSTVAWGQSFGFVSVGGGLYCNHVRFTDYDGSLITGYDDLSACGSLENSTIVGFNATVPNDGPAAHGPGIVFGDSIFATLYGETNAEWAVFMKLKCNKQKNGKYIGAPGWEGVAAFSGYVGSVNYGPLSCSAPGKNGKVATKGPTIRQSNEHHFAATDRGWNL